MLLRGLLRRCPWCGGRGWFTRWLRRSDRCVDCGYRYERQDGFLLGAVAINTIITFGLIAVVLTVGIVTMIPDIKAGPILMPLIAVSVLGPIVLYPISYTVWAAVDLFMRPLDDAEQLDAVEWMEHQRG
jgi:uncharacterized protein (DUF983 family)